MKFSLELMAHPDILYFPRLEEIVVPDDSTVVLRSEKPGDGLDWWTVYYPKHLLEDEDPENFFEWDFWTRPVGNGPYRWGRFVPKTMVELEANSDYFLGKSRIERLVVKFGGGSLLAELLSGQVDAATFLSRADLPKLEADPRFRVYHQIEPVVGWVEGIYWNLRNPLFSDARVRRALTLAIDREELRKLQGLPDGLPIFDVLFTGRQFWADELPEPLPFDPEAARTLLEQTGWRDTDSDGVRERGGQEFRFTVLVQTGGPSQTHGFGQAAIYVQAAFRRVGVHMEIRALESGLRQRVRAGEFEAAFDRFFRGGALRHFETLGYDDPRVIALLEEARFPADSAATDRLFREMWPILGADLPLTFLAPQVQYFVAHRRIKGLSSPFRARTLMHMEHAWVEEDGGGDGEPGFFHSLLKLRAIRPPQAARGRRQGSIERLDPLHVPAQTGGEVEKIPSSELRKSVHQLPRQPHVVRIHTPDRRDPRRRERQRRIQAVETVDREVGVEEFLKNLGRRRQWGLFFEGLLEEGPGFRSQGMLPADGVHEHIRVDEDHASPEPERMERSMRRR